MGQTATLFRARRLAFENSRRTGTGAFRPAVLAAIVVGIAIVVALGELSTASLLEVPVDTATPAFGKRAAVAGDGALEAAFWLSTLLSSFFAFRVMESLFRSVKVRALELLPVRPGPIFVERCVNALVEAIGLAAILAAFFLPLAWHGHAMLAGLCTLIGLGAMVCTAATTIGTNAWFGAQYGGSSGIGDGYGGQGGAFIYAPMVSFALAIVCVMMLQLGTREVLHAERLSNAFWLAIGISTSIATAALVVGGRHFVASYHHVAAFFREADEVGFRAVMDYQESSWSPARGESLAGDGHHVFRRHQTQFGRRFPVARSLVVIGSAGGAIGAATMSAAAFPDWAVAALPATLFAVLERPFGRIDDELLGGASDVFLPLSSGTLERARAAWSLAEVSRVALPYALIAGASRAWRVAPITGLQVAVGAAASCLAVVALVSVARRGGLRGAGTATAVAVAGTAGLAGLLAADLLFGSVVSAILAVVGIMMSLRQEARRD